MHDAKNRVEIKRKYYHTPEALFKSAEKWHRNNAFLLYNVHGCHSNMKQPIVCTEKDLKFFSLRQLKYFKINRSLLKEREIWERERVDYTYNHTLTRMYTRPNKTSR